MKYSYNFLVCYALFFSKKKYKPNELIIFTYLFLFCFTKNQGINTN